MKQLLLLPHLPCTANTELLTKDLTRCFLSSETSDCIFPDAGNILSP
ncbi:hypothetical protein LINGRAPRIM_LOCUS426, partial [Linum grandiflorum]